MDEPLYTMKFKIEDVYLLYNCVNKRLENLSEPTMHPFEEERLIFLRDGLYRAILDYKFKHT